MTRLKNKSAIQSIEIASVKGCGKQKGLQPWFKRSQSWSGPAFFWQFVPDMWRIITTDCFCVSCQKKKKKIIIIPISKYWLTKNQLTIIHWKTTQVIFTSLRLWRSRVCRPLGGSNLETRKTKTPEEEDPVANTQEGDWCTSHFWKCKL